MTAEPKGPSVALQLVDLALEEWELIQSDEGRPYAVPMRGPRVAAPIDGGRSSLRSSLAELYFTDTNKVPSRNALSEAMEVLRGRALHADREPVALRHAKDRNVRLIDLGDDTGEGIALSIGAAVIAPSPGVAFRRTELTAPFPRPDGGYSAGSLDEFRDLLNVTDDGWEMLVGWMVAVLLGDIAAPILYLNGEQGTGKTTIARRVVAMTDPSTVPVRSAPKDVESWVVTANGSRVIALDNLSSIPGWFSDALCRAVTGDGLVRRALYTDDELAVTTFRRAIILTSIDAGAIAGDLGERLLPLDLERIPDRDRAADSDLERRFADAYPGAFAELVALAAKVADIVDRGDTPDVDLPRMADFGRVLLAVDSILHTNSFDAYRTAVADIFRDLVNGDPLAEAIVAITRLTGRWDGTAAELHKVLDAHRPEDKRSAWPKTARGVSGAVRRLAPSLRTVGVHIEHTREHGGTRMLHLTALGAPGGDDGDSGDGRSSVPAFKKEERSKPELESAELETTVQPSQPSPSLLCATCEAPTKVRDGNRSPRCLECWTARR